MSQAGKKKYAECVGNDMLHKMSNQNRSYIIIGRLSFITSEFLCYLKKLGTLVQGNDHV
jgi:hypothetical protein